MRFIPTIMACKWSPDDEANMEPIETFKTEDELTEWIEENTIKVPITPDDEPYDEVGNTVDHKYVLKSDPSIRVAACYL